MSLKQLLAERDAARRLYFADESGGEPAASAFKSGPALILIGPEGGFTDEERASFAPRRTASRLARPPHPARRNRRAGRSRRLDGGCRRLAAYRAISQNNWRVTEAR